MNVACLTAAPPLRGDDAPGSAGFPPGGRAAGRPGRRAAVDAAVRLARRPHAAAAGSQNVRPACTTSAVRLTARVSPLASDSPPTGGR